MIKELLEQLSKKDLANSFAVFDFDNTCIANDIAEATLNYMARHAMFRDAAILPGQETMTAQERAENIFRHYYQLLAANDVMGAYEFGARTLSGLKDSEIGPLVAAVIATEGEAIGQAELYGTKIAKGLAMRPAVIDLMNELQQQKTAIWVVSASPRLLVAEAMKYFGIAAELIGVRHKIVNNTVTAELQYPLSVMDGKVDNIKLFINPSTQPILGVGDSMNDCPMLEYCDLKAVVDRGNALTKKAKAEGWFIIN